MSTFSSSDLKLHWEDIISLRPLLGAWLNTDDWNRIWPLCGEIWNEEQCLSDCVSKHFPLLPLWCQINASCPLRQGSEAGLRLFIILADDSYALSRTHFKCLLFFPSIFFCDNMGPWDLFESFLNKQNIFLIKLCVSVHEVVLKVRTMIFLRVWFSPSTGVSTV